VVPAYNESKLIEGCLRSVTGALALAAVAETDYELLVVDNRSSDDTAARAAKLGARVIYEPVRQIARARNRGGSVARGDWILFLDADSWPSGALMRDLARVMGEADIAGGGSLMQMQNLTFLLRLCLWTWNRISRWLCWAAGSFIFCTRDAFATLGGFDESLFVGEEIDFSRRLKRYARQRGQRLVILRGHPLCTSGRKGELYTPREILTMGARMLRHPRRFFRDPSLCTLWYDGRR
jgi:glycosyltransferase involved in cell wall biosynthesis